MLLICRIFLLYTHLLQLHCVGDCRFVIVFCLTIILFSAELMSTLHGQINPPPLRMTTIYYEAAKIPKPHQLAEQQSMKQQKPQNPPKTPPTRRTTNYEEEKTPKTPPTRRTTNYEEAKSHKPHQDRDLDFTVAEGDMRATTRYRYLRISNLRGMEMHLQMHANFAHILDREQKSQKSQKPVFAARILFPIWGHI